MLSNVRANPCPKVSLFNFITLPFSVNIYQKFVRIIIIFGFLYKEGSVGVKFVPANQDVNSVVQEREVCWKYWFSKKYSLNFRTQTAAESPCIQLAV